ncbi:Rha family transcriptional regulator [Cysteiniphilum sp. 6C5]|uniref:Rha family transcriptional regulator n=1 Tax=unclassified Cysteiniphilum TaxID=2610889 RepID=UPI003F865915
MLNLSVQQTINMSSSEIAELVEKRHDNVKRTIDTLLEKSLISHPQIEDGKKSANGVVEKVYLIGKRDSYVIVAQLSPEFTARLVDRWQELEAKAQSNLPNFDNPAEAARAWALQYEQNKRLEVERNEAITTKAWISDKKTATAMNTASQMSKKVHQLENELGKGKHYKTVKAIHWLLDYFNNTKAMYSVIGRNLSALSNRLGYECQTVANEEYGTIKAYHVDVIEELKHQLDDDLNHLSAYRK